MTNIIKLNEASPVEEARLMPLLCLGEVNHIQPGNTREITAIVIGNFVL